MSPSRLGAVAARLLGIDLNYRSHLEPEQSLRSAAESVSHIDTFTETDPSVREWIISNRPTRESTIAYLRSLFPFLSWILHYNATWLVGDIVAGVTVGFVVIPQAMAYALLAQLSPEYGLYTAFVGLTFYWMFATSKDITIGTVAVMSQLVGNIIGRARETHPELQPSEIARALSLITGVVILGIGLIRWGWIVEFIPLVAIASFMTGASISIGVGQVPSLLGIRGVNTRAPTYQVAIETLKSLPDAGIDAAAGMTALVLLYLIRWACNVLAKRYPSAKKWWFFISTGRMAFIVLLAIGISGAINKDAKEASDSPFRILGPVPRGFGDTGAPKINSKILSVLAPDLPATIIVLIIEHIAISKSFGRINNYVIEPSQELVAVGLTNIFGPFLGAYPATGSFTRTAIKSKAGVRTPLGGIFTAVIVIAAMYGMNHIFFYIPMSALAALIIHAVGDLISSPNSVYQFWELSPLEVLIFFAGVLTTIFVSIETGIYVSVATSTALLLYRMAKANGVFLGRVPVYRVMNDGRSVPGSPAREAYVPLNNNDGSNPTIDIQSPASGIFVYRLSEGFNFLNQKQYMDRFVEYIFAETRPTETNHHEKLGDRPWNDPGPRRGALPPRHDDRPTLRAVILDFSSVNHLDVTAAQGLIDVRNQLDRHASPDVVEWHFSAVTNRWARRALAVAGFGYPSAKAAGNLGRWKPIFSVAPVEARTDSGEGSAGAGASAKEMCDEETGIGAQRSQKHAVGRVDGEVTEVKAGGDGVCEVRGETGRFAAIQGMNRPFFHIDVAAAVESAILNAGL